MPAQQCPAEATFGKKPMHTIAGSFYHGAAEVADSGRKICARCPV